MSVKPLTAWSYSRYALYEQCPLKFKLEVLEGIKQPASPAMERGNKVHVALANYVTGKTTTPPETHDKIRYVVEQIRDFHDKVVEQQWGFTKSWRPTGWFGKDTWFRATLDVGLLYEDLTGEVADWKTGKRYASNDDQMELFALSFMCQYTPATHVTTRLVYVDTGDEEIAEFAAKHKDALRAKWEGKVAPMFADTVFAPRPNDKCRFCAFARSKGDQCRFG
jgi:hypothetical protein